MPDDDATIDRDPGAARTLSVGRSPLGMASELVELLDGYLADLQAGKAPDRERLLAEHPDLATRLEGCLAGIEFIHRATGTPAEEVAQLGEFRILGEIGRGGMGVVYEAEQTSLRRRVALKVLQFGAVADAEATERFRREAETVAHLHHTNIVPIFSVGCERGVHFYAMQFIEGRSLGDRLAQSQAEQAPIPVADVVGWGLQAAEALEYAHRRGVIHRDVKPSNLLLDPEGVVWLTDFGLARRDDEATMTLSGALMGTPRYMSPEQAEALSRPVDLRTDIYSLGATLYELATGRPVFEASTPHAILMRILADQPTRPRLIRPGLPRGLETIILTCLAKDPARRYPSARALADDLRAVLDGRPIRARRASLAERSARWARRNRRAVGLAAASAAASVLLLAGAALGWDAYRGARLGSVSLLTEEPHLSAEVLDEGSETVVLPRFSLPTRGPVSLPEGSYLVRLSAPGMLSETSLFRVDRGEDRSYKVGLGERRLWDPLAVGKTDPRVEVLQRGDRSDLLEWSRHKIHLRDGRTSRPLWTLASSAAIEVVDPASGSSSIATLPGGKGPDLERDAMLAKLPSLYSEPPGVVPIAPDLDGDGEGDVVFACRGGAALWAFSGRPDDRGQPRELWSFDGGLGAVVGLPAIVDADGDGTPDVVATFANPARKWVEAVSGKTGRSLWARDLDGSWFRKPTMSSAELIFAAEAVAVDGRAYLVVATPSRVAMIDAGSGELAWDHAPQTLPVFPPRLGDLDGDGTDDLLLVGEGPAGALLEAISLRARKALWSRPISGQLRFGKDAENCDWPLVADLDGDGRAEVAVPAAPPQGQGTWAGVEVREGATGDVRWTRRVRSPIFPVQVDRFLDGPDIDGDGCRELFVASRGEEATSLGFPKSHVVVYVDALSGNDGRGLWWWRRPLEEYNDAIGPLRWWNSGEDGWPQLLVPLRNWVEHPISLCLLSAPTGRISQEIPGGMDPREADFDGDGVTDLSFCFASEADRRQGVATFHALRGLPPSPWRRLGHWTPARDFDGDGLVDSVEIHERTVAAATGKYGRILWRSPATDLSPLSDFSLAPQLGRSVDDFAGRPSAPGADLDGDGTPDLLLTTMNAPALDADGDRIPVPLRAISGKTGRTIWEAQGIPAPGVAGIRLAWPTGVFCEDLDGDGRSEVAVSLQLHAPTTSPQRFQARLAVFSSRDGRLIWQALLAEDASAGPSPLRELHPGLAAADLDGDGVRDLALAVPRRREGGGWAVELLALGGRDGRPLWRAPVGTRADFSWGAGQLPTPVVGDVNADGRIDVVVADHDLLRGKGPPPGGNCLEVHALDGRDGRPLWPCWRGRDDAIGVGLGGMAPPILREGTIVVGLREKDQARIVVLGPDGKVSRERTLREGAVEPIERFLHAVDLDGDGREELAFAAQSASGTTVVALDAGLEGVSWRRTIPGYARLVATLPAIGGRAEQIVVGGLRNRVEGLDGRTGATTWRGTGLSGQEKVTVNGLPLFHSEILPANDAEGPPRIVGTVDDVTVCLTTSPSAWRRTPVRTSDEDPRHVRPLPWASEGPIFARAFLSMGLIAAATLVLPCLAVATILRRRPVRLAHLLILPLLAAGIYAFLARIAPHLDQAALAPILGPDLLEGLSGPKAAALVLGSRAILGLPVVAILALPALWLRRRRWWAASAAVVASVALSAAIALWTLDRPAPDQHFSTAGWAWIWPVGAYVAGLLLSAWLVLKTVARLSWSAVRRLFDLSTKPRGATP